MPNRQQITWITPDYFLNVDAKVVPQLANYYPIDWILIRTPGSERNSDGLLSDAVRPREFILRYRQGDPRIISQYVSLLSSIRRRGYDLLYTSFHGLPYFFPMLSTMIDLDKVIYGVHNVHTPKGATNEWQMRMYQRYAFRVMKRFHVFSKYQLRVIEEILPARKHYYAPFAPDDYGTSNARPPLDRIRFTSFGYIREYKRLDLLISAFKTLYDEGLRNIELVIAGKCDDWGPYEALIDNHPRIHARIGVAPNKEIPDLISSSHYLVLPYQDGAQSAVLPLAYKYHKPVITSDIDAFRDVVLEGTTGYRFRSLSHESLCQVMREVILRHDADYDTLTRNVCKYVANEYSSEDILAKYRFFIDDTLDAARRRDLSLHHAPLF
jgi:glycosyltransferase involved in cell wall biosynthesis